MKIKDMEFEINGRTYYLAIKHNNLVFSNDLERIGSFKINSDMIVEASHQIFEFIYGYKGTNGDVQEIQRIVSMMIGD